MVTFLHLLEKAESSPAWWSRASWANVTKSSWVGEWEDGGFCVCVCVCMCVVYQFLWVCVVEQATCDFKQGEVVGGALQDTE